MAAKSTVFAVFVLSEGAKRIKKTFSMKRADCKSRRIFQSCADEILLCSCLKLKGGILMKENLYVGFIPTGCVTETLPNPPDDLAIAAEILQDITQLIVCSVAMATGRQPEAGHPSASVRRRCWRDGCFQLTSARDSFD